MFGEAPVTPQNIIVALHDLPVTALYDETNEKGLIELWEPSDDQGDIKTQLANTDSSGNGQGGPDLSGAYQVTCKALAQGLQATLCDAFDCSGVLPFSLSKYKPYEEYTTQRDFGRVVLAYYAHHLFGHVDATAAITNDVAFVHSMLSTTTGGGQEDASGADIRYAGWTKSVTNPVEQWDASGSTVDANLALRLVRAIVAKGKNTNGSFKITSVNTATTDSLAYIVKQVIRQDSSRMNNVDGSERTRDQHQLLRFYANDIIYVNINVLPPTVVVSQYNPNPNNVANPPSTTGMEAKSFTLKIRLTDGTTPPSPTPADPFVYTDGTKTVLTGYTGAVPSSLTIPDGVLEIAAEAFLDKTTLISVSLPTGLTTIGARAFKGCTALTSINIPSTVVTIGESAFEGCTSLTTALLPGTGKSLSLPSLRLTRTAIFSVIPVAAFKGCTALNSVSVPSGVLTIKESAFEGCSALEALTIPTGITSIEQKAFKGAGLTSVSLPTGITSLGASTFENCTGLTSITVPSNVTSIGASAFAGCTALASITIPSSVTSIGAAAFAGTGPTNISVPAKTSLGVGAFDNGVTVNIISTGNRTVPVDASGNMISSGTVILGQRADNAVTQINPIDLSGFTFNMNGTNYGSTIYVATNGQIAFTTAVTTITYTLTSAMVGIACNGFDTTTNRITYFRTTTATYDIVTIQLWIESGYYEGRGAENYLESPGQIQVRLIKSLLDSKQYVEMTTNKGSSQEISVLGQWAVANGSALVTASAITAASQMFPSSGTRSILFTDASGNGNAWSAVAENAYLDLDLENTSLESTKQPKLNKNWTLGSVGEPSAGSITFRAIITDSQKNVYTCGTSSRYGIVTIQNIGQNATTNSNVSVNLGVNNVVLIKYNEAGIAQWAVPIRCINAFVDRPYQIATDASGNVYITGSYNSSSKLPLNNANGTSSGVSLPSTTVTDAFLVKYNSSGTVQWCTAINGTLTDGGYGLATDASNNVYIAGQYNNTASPLALNNADGNSSGVSLPSTTGIDAFLVKYNSSGTVQWCTSIKGSGSDYGYGVATDASGNVYITGTYVSTSAITLQASPQVQLPITTSNDVFLVKYDSSGTVQWCTSIKGSGSDYGYGVATDASGNVYITGTYVSTSAITLQASPLVQLPASNSNGNDAFLVKYDSNGTPLWCKTIGGNGADYGYGVATDASGNVYITGYYNSSVAFTLQASPLVQLPASICNSLDAFLVKYDSSGTVQWYTTIGGTNSDVGNGLATDASGNVYIIGIYSTSSNITLQDVSGTGLVNSSFTLPANNTSAAYPCIVKYNTNGITLGVSSIIPYKSATGTNYKCAADSSGNIYAVGYYTSISAPFFIRKINGTGQEYSTKSLPAAATTSPYLIKYDATGDVLWAVAIQQATSASYGYGVATDASGNVYITGYYNSTTTVALNNADGTPSGVSLPITTGNDVFLVKYNSSGTVQWRTSIKGTGADYGYGVATDASGNVYIAGQYNNTASPLALNNADGNSSGVSLPSTTGTDAFLVKYNSSGTVQWCTSIKGSGSDYGYGVATDASGNVYITGTYVSTSAITLQASPQVQLPITTSNGNDVFLVKYDSNGTPLWCTTIVGSGVDYGYGVATDASGNVYITGYYTSSGAVALNNADGNPSGVSLPITTSNDVFLVKYNSSGTVQWCTSIKGSSADYSYQVATDASGNVYIAGYCLSYANIYDAGQSTVKYGLPYSSNGGFIVKYDSNGVAIAASSTLIDSLYGINTNSCIVYGLCISGNKVYICGNYTLIYSKDPEFSSSMVLPPASGGSFLLKYDA